MKRKIRIISDAPLLGMAVVGTVVMTLAAGIGIVIIGIPGAAADPSEVVSMQIMFGVLFLIFLVAVVSAVSQSICVITLAKDGISLKIPFQKRQFSGYEKYPYIFYGCYFHGNAFGMGKWVPYIVFARNRVSLDLRNQINHLKNTPEAFKIRYTKKNYDALCAMLPEKCRGKLEAALRKDGKLG